MRISDWSSDVCSSDLARQQVPEEVAAAYGGARSFGPDYTIPAPFDPRLIEEVPLAVAPAAMDSGVSRLPLLDYATYLTALSAPLNPNTAVSTSDPEHDHHNIGVLAKSCLDSFELDLCTN